MPLEESRSILDEEDNSYYSENDDENWEVNYGDDINYDPDYYISVLYYEQEILWSGEGGETDNLGQVRRARKAVFEGHNWHQKLENKLCLFAYSAGKILRFIITKAENEPDITTRMISDILNIKKVYRRSKPPSHYSIIRRKLCRHMKTSFAVEMVALDGFAQLFWDVGHTVDI